MGRGDKRTQKGKRFKGSFGKTRLHKAKKRTVAVVQEKPVAAAAEIVAEAPVKKPRKKKSEESGS